MLSQWFLPHSTALLGVALSVLAMYLTVIVFARLSGVRSFAQMSTFDIAVTIAVGSLLATVVTSKDPALLQGMLALMLLYGLQLGVSWLRNRFRGFTKATDNPPILLMEAGGEIKWENMRVARVTENDLRTHLRKANVTARREVQAVVMEGTGTINVLHATEGQANAPDDDAWILQDVRDYTR
ncbi:DUF421 domain-containing protein [Salinisphaera orenii]|uniref:DUF421 domain-containing protein n=1 Tax=Salinisphaera orenii TaxID=856731 RepID=UPI000DBE0508